MEGSFYNVLKAIRLALESDADLVELCRTRFSKKHRAQLAFWKREEVHSDDMPLLCVTRPEFKAEPESGPMRGKTTWLTHDVMVYGYVYHEDRVAGMRALIEVQEVVERALRKDPTWGGMAKNTWALGGANNQGFGHPVYTFALSLQVQAKRVVPSPAVDEGYLEGIDFGIDQTPPGDGVADVSGKVDFPHN